MGYALGAPKSRRRRLLLGPFTTSRWERISRKSTQRATTGCRKSKVGQVVPFLPHSALAKLHLLYNGDPFGTSVCKPFMHSWVGGGESHARHAGPQWYGGGTYYTTKLQECKMCTPNRQATVGLKFQRNQSPIRFAQCAWGSFNWGLPCVG